MFRLLGLLAALDLRLNRIRFYFVPVNIGIAVVLAWGVSLGLARVADGPQEVQPRTVTVADLAAGRVAAGSFVRVSGVVAPGIVLRLGDKGAGGTVKNVRERLRLLHDAGPGAVWLNPGAVAVDAWTRVTFAGMVRPLPTAARDATAREGRAIGHRTPSLDVLLEHGTRPRSFVSGVVHLAICAPLLALLAWVWVTGRVIFRAGRRTAMDSGPADDPIDLRVSGRLQLDHRTSRRFVEVPAQLGWIEGGGLAVAANVDASSYVMGVRAIAREGTWTLAIPADATITVVAGAQAFGRSVRPAARVDVRRGGRGTTRLILTFGNGSQRDRVLQVLHAVFGARRPAAA